MKRRYNTLNEEMNRMKSLFGESRLYGNLVDNEEKNILTEGYRFFDNLSDAFKLTFRSLDDLGKFTKFINVEINNVDDIVKHVRQFPGLWKTIASDVKNWDGVLKNLEVLSGLQKSDKLKNIGTLDWYDSLAGYPQIGGMQDMIDDMWRVSKGKDSTFENLPAVIGTKKAVYDPEKGGIVIKTEKKMNNDTLIDSEGNVIATMDDKGNWVNSKGEIIDKPKDSKVKTEPEEAEIVPPTKTGGDVIDSVKKGTTMKELDNKTVLDTPENRERVGEAINEQRVDSNENGDEFLITISGKGKDGTRRAKEYAEGIRAKEMGNPQEAAEDVAKNSPLVKNNGDGTPPDKKPDGDGTPPAKKPDGEETIDEVKKNILVRGLKNIFTKYPTKYYLNFPALGEGKTTGFWDMKFDTKTGKNQYGRSIGDQFKFQGYWGGTVAVRTVIFVGGSFLGRSAYKDYVYDRGVWEGLMTDWALWTSPVLQAADEIMESDDFLNGVHNTIMIYTNNKVNLKSSLNEIIIKGMENIQYAGDSTKSNITCADLKKPLKDIVELSVKIEKLEQLQKMNSEVEKYYSDNFDLMTKTQKDVKEAIEKFIEKQTIDENSEDNWFNMVEQKKNECRAKEVEEKYQKELKTKTYNVEFVSKDTTQVSR